MINIHHIGHHTSIEGWPAPNTLAGLLDALGRWALDPRMDMREPEEQHLPPFRGRAWGDCVKRYDFAKGHNVIEATRPIYPESLDAVSYLGNFEGYSFAFSLDTDEPAVIAQLDAAIAANMARPDYREAFEEMQRRAEEAAQRAAARERARAARQRG